MANHLRFRSSSGSHYLLLATENAGNCTLHGSCRGFCEASNRGYGEDFTTRITRATTRDRCHSRRRNKRRSERIQHHNDAGRTSGRHSHNDENGLRIILEEVREEARKTSSSDRELLVSSRHRILQQQSVPERRAVSNRLASGSYEHECDRGSVSDFAMPSIDRALLDRSWLLGDGRDDRSHGSSRHSTTGILLHGCSSPRHRHTLLLLANLRFSQNRIHHPLCLHFLLL